MTPARPHIWTARHMEPCAVVYIFPLALARRKREFGHSETCGSGEHCLEARRLAVGVYRRPVTVGVHLARGDDRMSCPGGIFHAGEV